MTTNPPARSSAARKAWVFIGLALAFAIVAALAASLVGSVAYEPIALRHREFTSLITAVSVHVSSGDITIEPEHRRRHGRGHFGRPRVDVSDGRGAVSSATPWSSPRVAASWSLRQSVHSRTMSCRLQPGVAVMADSEQGIHQRHRSGRSLSVHSDQGDVNIVGGSGTLRASSGPGETSPSPGRVATSVSVHRAGRCRRRSDGSTEPGHRVLGPGRRDRRGAEGTDLLSGARPARARATSPNASATIPPALGWSTPPRDRGT